MKFVRKQRVPDVLLNTDGGGHLGNLANMVLCVQPSRDSLPATFDILEIDLRKIRVGPLLSSSHTLVLCA
jgi:hypothetical protein